MSCDLSTVLHIRREGSAFIALYLDISSAVSSHFLTMYTVQVSVQVFATKKAKMEGHNLYVTLVCDRWDVLIFS